MSRNIKSSISSPRQAAFTLVELLVVTGLIAVMAALAGPALVAIKGGEDMTKNAYDIAGLLEQARAYAMANNTYVFVGLEEVDASRTASVVPQLPGTGRVAVAVIASKDGTRDYDVTNGNLSIPPFVDQNGNPVSTGTNFVAISKLMYFENTHLASAGVLNGPSVAVNSSGSVGSGRMERPAIVANDCILANGSDCVTAFAWPLGIAYNSNSAQYNFGTVVNFDPQGVARLQTANNADAIGQYMEIGLEPAHGNVVQQTPPSNVAVIQIDAMTGATHIYRP